MITDQWVTRESPTEKEPPITRKKNAARMAVRSGGESGIAKRPSQNARPGQWRRVPQLTSVRLRGLFTYEGAWYGLQVTR